MKTKPFVVVMITLMASLYSCEQEEQLAVTYSEMAYASMDNQYASSENYKEYPENAFMSTAEQNTSTFSVDADGGSYANMRRYLYIGQAVPQASVRIEEFLNYFTFDYSDPTDGHHVALNSELSTCPWNTKHYLMRLGIKGKTIPENELPNSNYVFLIDVSGSMNDPEKLGILKRGFTTMVDQLRDQDRVAIVTYAGEAGLLLPSTQADQKNAIKKAIDQLGAGGSTAGAAGITTAYEIAEEYFLQGGNNRVILGTDGDFNVGASSTEELIELIEEKRDAGIYLTVLGVGTGNLNDHMLEQIANKGNGNYEYIDNVAQIEKVFTHEKGKFYTVAKDAKIQLTFNESLVDSFRLIGYENRALDNEDFEDDSTDAGEICSSQTITALYQVVLKESSISEHYAQFNFRYKKPDEDNSLLLTHVVDSKPKDISAASQNIRFAAAVTGFGLLLRQSDYKANANKQMVLELLNGATSFDPNGYRNEFAQIVGSWAE